MGGAVLTCSGSCTQAEKSSLSHTEARSRRLGGRTEALTARRWEGGALSRLVSPSSHICTPYHFTGVGVRAKAKSPRYELASQVAGTSAIPRLSTSPRSTLVTSHTGSSAPV